MAANAFILHNPWALGDTVAMSALPRDIQRTYPGKYELYFSGHFRSFWDNNPHGRWAPPGVKGQLVRMDYLDGIRAAGRGERVHFLSWFHRDFERKTGIYVPVTLPKGDIHLSKSERAPKYPGRYWVVMAGGKLDMTTKVWYTQRYQEVVDRLGLLGISCVQAGAEFRKHFQPRLKNCLCLVGQTNSIRDFFSLIYNAEGVICGITAAMHIAAAFDKPCVVVAGGREEPWWEATYPGSTFGPRCDSVRVPHRFLHTIGLLDCCATKGCWKDRTVPLEPSDTSNARRRAQLCKLPMRDEGQPMPKCMAMITADHVIDAVLSYYREGILPWP